MPFAETVGVALSPWRMDTAELAKVPRTVPLGYVTGAVSGPFPVFGRFGHGAGALRGKLPSV